MGWLTKKTVEKAVDRGFDIVDEAFDTKQERNERAANLTSDTISSYTRKFLAISTNVTILGLALFAVVITVFFQMKEEVLQIIAIANAFNLGDVFIAQNLFYFASSSFNKAASKSKEKAMNELREIHARNTENLKIVMQEQKERILKLESELEKKESLIEAMQKLQTPRL